MAGWLPQFYGVMDVMKQDRQQALSRVNPDVMMKLPVRQWWHWSVRTDGDALGARNGSITCRPLGQRSSARLVGAPESNVSVFALTFQESDG